MLHFAAQHRLCHFLDFLYTLFRPGFLLPIALQNFIEKVGDYITDICYLACNHHVKLESAFINAALAVEIMEGIASALYPDMRVQGVALPLIVKAEMMHRMGFH